MKLHTISNYEFEWKRADGKKVSDKLIRELIGESIPPAGLEKIFRFLSGLLNERGQNKVSAPHRGQQELCL
jgi:DNA (cytosine-5)-methyltransferase 1